MIIKVHMKCETNVEYYIYFNANQSQKAILNRLNRMNWTKCVRKPNYRIIYLIKNWSNNLCETGDIFKTLETY